MIHDIVVLQRFDHGHGHLIEAGTASTGARTILAYYADGHAQRVNYYSNPAVTFPATGTPTGVEGVSNNAAVITANRSVGFERVEEIE